MVFSYSLTAIPTLTVVNIKYTPYVSVNDILIDIVFNQYLRQGMGKCFSPKTRNESIVASFRFSIFPMVSCPFCEKSQAGV